MVTPRRPGGQGTISQYGQPVARLVGPLYQAGQCGEPWLDTGTGAVAALAEIRGAPTASAVTIAATDARRLVRYILISDLSGGSPRSYEGILSSAAPATGWP